MENVVYNRKMEYIYICNRNGNGNGVYNRKKNGVYNDCFDNRKMEYIIVGGNLCI